MPSTWAAWLLSPALLATVCHSLPYEQYILAPSTRELIPSAVYHINGSIINAAQLTRSQSGNTSFNGVSWATYDFGRNIGGIVSLDIGSVSAPDAFLGVTFTESSLWINHQASDATADTGLDSPIWFPVGDGPGTYTAEKKHTRGAFRYMTLVSNTTARVSVNAVRINYTAAPTQDLRAYKGYFHCDDDLINRIWYAGAYTNQLCTIDPSAGDALPLLGIIESTDNITLPQTTPWWNNYTVSNGSSTLTDGAKRDRLIWPGDMSIALESVAVSTADLYSVRTALETLLSQQKSNGRLPYASEPFRDTVSYTYHLHSLIGVSYYYRHAGDKQWLSRYWRQYEKGLQWALSSVDETGMANVTASDDWLRFGMGGHNIEANAILYFVLNEAIDLAKALKDEKSSSDWASIASKIKAATNGHLWDTNAGLYRDNETTTLHPQDGNAWAIKANLTVSQAQKQEISSALSSRWGPYGAPAPEAGETVSPFIGGFELQAHYLSGRAEKALELMRRQWGFMLDDPRMTQSTFIEGYSTDGSLHYAPYTNDARVSHAHGWSTGPTAALTFFAAGLHLTGPAGATWRFAPQPGNLTSVDAGFSTVLGSFDTTFERSENGGYSRLRFSTPRGTVGDVDLGGEGVLVSENGTSVRLVDGAATGLRGGLWRLVST
ncbi:Six-hairpin glycosidase-like protein [Aspergillus floccosus]